MPGQICAVACCTSNQLTLKIKGIHVILHKFPKCEDLVSSTIRQQWVHRCKRADKFNVANSRVCSLYFTENDYERDLQSELLGTPSRKILKKTAVPTLSIGRKEEKYKVKKTPRDERALQKENKNIAKKITITHLL